MQSHFIISPYSFAPPSFDGFALYIFFIIVENPNKINAQYTILSRPFLFIMCNGPCYDRHRITQTNKPFKTDGNFHRRCNPFLLIHPVCRSMFAYYALPSVLLTHNPVNVPYGIVYSGYIHSLFCLPEPLL